jgi:HD-like signal output (HDOD) protein
MGTTPALRVVEPSSATPAGHPLEEKLVHQLRSGRAALPMLPRVATLALRLASDPNASVQELADLVDGDPPIAARFLSVANSAAYYRGYNATSTHGAIVRLGLANARDLLFQVVYASSTNGLKRYQRQVQESFTRSVTAGVAARLICREQNRRYEYDYMCGLLHNIGEARIYRILSTFPRPKEGIALIDELVARHHASAGAEVAMDWRLPSDIVDVCAAHHDSAAAEAPHVRLVMAADTVVSILEREKAQGEMPSLEPLLAFELSAAQAERVVARTRELAL